MKKQTKNDKKKDNSIKKDIGLAFAGIAGFYGVLILANYADSTFGLTQAYTLVDIASLALKVTTASAIAWILKRLVFAQTLGKDFGSTFNAGWEKLDIKEKARWIIATFLIIFFSVIIAST